MDKPAEPEGTSKQPATGEQNRTPLPKIIAFSDLCRCGDEIWIDHNGQLYRLRKTRQGKLILTK